LIIEKNTLLPMLFSRISLPVSRLFFQRSQFCGQLDESNNAGRGRQDSAGFKARSFHGFMGREDIQQNSLCWLTKIAAWP
jgi:hypothetical protein